MSNALTEDHRDAVLTAALQGEQSVCGDRLEWRVSRHPEEEEKLQVVFILTAVTMTIDLYHY